MSATARRTPRAFRLLPGAVAALAAVALIAVGGAAVLSGGDLRYAWRVVVHGDAGTDDVAWKAAVAIPAAPDAATPEVADGCAAVEEAAGLGLEAYLEAGGATALLVVRDGEPICAWAADGDPDAARPVFSVSKTVLSLALARAVEAGAAGYDDPITAWVPELLDRDPGFARIALGDLVDMRSGIAFQQETSFPWIDRDAPRVYYASDLRSTTLTAPQIEGAPGGFVYTDYAPNLVGLALERATGEPVPAGLVADLWRDLGAPDDAAWLVDEHGFAWHESGLVASPADLAAVGALLLDDAEGGVDLPAGAAVFADRSTTGNLDVVATFGGVELGYRNGWWLLEPGSASPAYAAMGRFGQIMVVDPATSTIVVRLGDDGFEHVESNAAIAERLLGWARALA